MSKSNNGKSGNVPAVTTGKRDGKAPGSIQLAVSDATGKVWGSVSAMPKNFATGSVGYYGNAKIVNPENPDARYQLGITVTLIGSKPQA
jgi:hypothetical protein